MSSGCWSAGVGCQRSAHNPAMLMYTSGTTGRSKGALWSHANTLWFAAIQAMRWGLDGQTVAMTTGPMYHVGAVAIVEVPDPKFVETVCAVVVPMEGVALSEEDIIGFCRQRLAGYKRPRHVVFQKALPRTPSGKLMTYVLRENYRALGRAPGGAE